MYNYKRILLLVTLLPLMLVACNSKDNTEIINGNIISEKLDAKSYYSKLKEIPNAQLVDVASIALVLKTWLNKYRIEIF